MPVEKKSASKRPVHPSRAPTGLRSSKYSVTAENLAAVAAIRIDKETDTMLDELKRACFKSRNAAFVEGIHLLHAANIEAIRKERRESK